MFRFSTTWSLFVVLGCTSILGCSHPKPRPEVARPPPPPSAVEKLKAGSTLVVTRPTPGVARLSLWIDSGSRNATVPQLATLAAFWAEDRSGVKGRVLPDGTEFSLMCETQSRELERCIKRLTQVLSLPLPSSADAERLRARLRSARQRARGDVSREATELAFEALFRADSQSLFPLGQEASDGLLDAATIGRFLREHYASPHALLIAAGDATEAQVSKAFSANLPKAGPVKARVERPLAGRSGLRVQLGQENVLSLAVLVPSTEIAASLGQRLRKLYPTLSARVTNLQGARLLSLHLPAGTKPGRRVQRLVFDVRRLALEGQERAPTRPEESLEAITRIIGEDWAARGPVAPPNFPWPLGVGLVARSDGANPAADEKRLAELTKEIENAVAAGERASLGEMSGAVDVAATSVTTPNGARVETRRREGDAWMSAVVRFQGGSATDPATRHGRSALLAALMSDGCDFADGRSLDAHLVHLEARVQPLVSANHVGVMITAPKQRWAEAIDTLLQCTLSPALTTRALDDARLKLTRSLRARDDLRWQRHLAALLAPSHPGIVAPYGAADPVASVHINEIRRLHSELLAGARVSVMAVTSHRADEVARYVARRVGLLPKGTPSSATAAKDLKLAEGILGERTEPGPLRVVVGVRGSTAGTAASLAAEVFAASLSRALSAKGLSVLTSWGDATGDFVYSGTALALREDDLTRLDRLVKEALGDVQRLPEAHLEAALTQARMGRSAAASSAQGYARAYFLDAINSTTKTGEAVTSIRKLAQAKPSFYVLRPKP